MGIFEGVRPASSRAGGQQTQRCARERGFTLIELLIVVAVVSALAAIAVPSMLRARMTADETAAVSSMRAINSAQASYSAAGGGGYAVDLATLGRSCTPGALGYLSPDLAINPAIKNGYRYQIQAATGSAAGPTDCNGTATRTGYYSTSVPVSSTAGQKAFSSNTAASIYVSMTGVAPTEAAMAPSTAVG